MFSRAERMIDRSYRLHEQLGQGGMGTVYRATQMLTGRQVALKLISTYQHTGASTDSRHATGLHLSLAREFQTLASLHHPHVIRVLSYGFEDDLGPYFTMELLQAPQTLLEAAAEQSLQGKILLMAQLLRALVYVHQRGILHRDIKPAHLPSRNENGTGWGKRREKQKDDHAAMFGCQSVRYSFCATIGNKINSREFTLMSTPEWE